MDTSTGDCIRQFGRREDGEEDEGLVVRIVRRVNGARWDVGHFPCFQDAALLADPLLGATVDDVDDLFPVRVVMEGVAVIRVHVGPDEEKLVGIDQFGIAEPLVVGPGIGLPCSVVDLNETVSVGGVGHGVNLAKGWLTRNCDKRTSASRKSNLALGI